METEIDNITLVRDYLREHPNAKVQEVRKALSLANDTVTQILIQEAKKREIESQQRIASEDAVIPVREVERIVEVPRPLPERFYLETQSGIAHKLKLEKETAGMLTFAFVEEDLGVAKVS